MAFSINTAPSGWLKADGSAVSRTTFANLFAAIGVQFGTGNGSTTFNLPDLRGEFVRGWDDGRGADPSRAFGDFQDSDNKSHTHNFSGSAGTAGNHGHSFPLTAHDGGSSTIGGDQWHIEQFSGAGQGDETSVTNVTGAAGNHSHSVSGTVFAQGGNEARPRNISLLYCIKT